MAYRRIEVARRGPDGLRWEVYISGHVVPEVGLDVDALHDALDATAATS